jgi:hypothetical protein
MGTLHAGLSILVPKPYTPYSRVAVLSKHEFRRRLGIVERNLNTVDNLKIDRPSYREALWQSILSRGDTGTYGLIDQIADHGELGRLLKDNRLDAVRRAVETVEGDPVWRFIGSAPTAESAVGSS